MAEPENLVQLACKGLKSVTWAVQIRGYLKADKGGVYSPSNARAIADYIYQLAEEADARNGTHLEGTSGIPYAEDTGTASPAGE